MSPASRSSSEAIRSESENLDSLVVDPELKPVFSADSHKKRFYVIRHWRGELSLGISYWVNHFLATFAVLIISASAGVLFQPVEGPLIWATAVSFVWVFACAATIWQLVGVWRSAAHHKARGGKGFWVGAARFMVIMGFLGFAGTITRNALPQLTEAWRIAIGDPEFSRHNIRVLRAGTEIEYSGSIPFGATDDLKRILDAVPTVAVVHLNSPGGRIAEARRIRDLIRARGLNTYTSSSCISACTIAFMGGVERYIAPDAHLSFHRGSFPGSSPSEIESEISVDRAWLISHGVPSWFVERAYSADALWSPSIDVLKQAGVVTKIARPEDFAVSGVLDVNEREVDATLSKIDSLAAIKRAEPEIYSQIRSAVFEGVKAGKSQPEIIGLVRPYTAEVAQKYLPHSSANALTDMTELLLEEIDGIQSKDPNACYKFIVAQPGQPGLVISGYVSDEIVKKDVLITAAVIDTGSRHPEPIPSEGDIESALKVVLMNLSKKLQPSDFAILQNLNSPATDRRRVCPVLSSMYREVLRLPPNDRVRLLRYLFNG